MFCTSIPKACNLSKKSGKLFATASAPSISPPVKVSSTVSDITIRWSLCPRSTSVGSMSPSAGGTMRISFSSTVTETPNLRSSAAMASPRSLSLILSRFVPINRPPCLAAAAAKRIGPRSGQSDRSMHGSDPASSASSCGKTRSACRLFSGSGRSSTTIRFSGLIAASAAKNAALEKSPSTCVLHAR